MQQLRAIGQARSGCITTYHGAGQPSEALATHSRLAAPLNELVQQAHQPPPTQLAGRLLLYRATPASLTPLHTATRHTDCQETLRRYIYNVPYLSLLLPARSPSSALLHCLPGGHLGWGHSTVLEYCSGRNISQTSACCFTCLLIVLQSVKCWLLVVYGRDRLA